MRIIVVIINKSNSFVQKNQNPNFIILTRHTDIT